MRLKSFCSPWINSVSDSTLLLTVKQVWCAWKAL